jgi:hypothetical protein
MGGGLCLTRRRSNVALQLTWGLRSVRLRRTFMASLRS